MKKHGGCCNLSCFLNSTAAAAVWTIITANTFNKNVISSVNYPPPPTTKKSEHSREKFWSFGSDATLMRDKPRGKRHPRDCTSICRRPFFYYFACFFFFPSVRSKTNRTAPNDYLCLELSQTFTMILGSNQIGKFTW